MESLPYRIISEVDRVGVLKGIHLSLPNCCPKDSFESAFRYRMGSLAAQGQNGQLQSKSRT